MIHLYWSMRNCGDSASKLRELIENIPQHYKVTIQINIPIGLKYVCVRSMLVISYAGNPFQVCILLVMPHTKLLT